MAVRTKSKKTTGTTFGHLNDENENYTALYGQMYKWKNENRGVPWDTLGAYRRQHPEWAQQFTSDQMTYAYGQIMKKIDKELGTYLLAPSSNDENNKDDDKNEDDDNGTSTKSTRVTKTRGSVGSSQKKKNTIDSHTSDTGSSNLASLVFPVDLPVESDSSKVMHDLQQTVNGSPSVGDFLKNLDEATSQESMFGKKHTKLVVIQELPSGATVQSFTIDQNGKSMTINLQRNRFLFTPEAILLAGKDTNTLQCATTSEEWMTRKQALASAIKDFSRRKGDEEVSSSRSKSSLSKNGPAVLNIDITVNFGQHVVDNEKAYKNFVYCFEGDLAKGRLPAVISYWEFEVLSEEKKESDLHYKAAGIAFSSGAGSNQRKRQAAKGGAFPSSSSSGDSSFSTNSRTAKHATTGGGTSSTFSGAGFSRDTSSSIPSSLNSTAGNPHHHTTKNTTASAASIPLSHNGGSKVAFSGQTDTATSSSFRASYKGPSFSFSSAIGKNVTDQVKNKGVSFSTNFGVNKPPSPTKPSPSPSPSSGRKGNLKNDADYMTGHNEDVTMEDHEVEGACDKDREAALEEEVKNLKNHLRNQVSKQLSKEEELKIQFKNDMKDATAKMKEGIKGHYRKQLDEVLEKRTNKIREEHDIKFAKMRHTAEAMLGQKDNELKNLAALVKHLEAKVEEQSDARNQLGDEHHKLQEAYRKMLAEVDGETENQEGEDGGSPTKRLKRDFSPTTNADDTDDTDDADDEDEYKGEGPVYHGPTETDDVDDDTRGGTSDTSTSL